MYDYTVSSVYNIPIQMYILFFHDIIAYFGRWSHEVGVYIGACESFSIFHVKSIVAL